MTTILLVDDHTLVREGFKQILADEPDLHVGGEASTGHEALDLIRTAAWDVVVLDLSLPDRSGIEVLQTIQDLPIAPPVLILTMHDQEQYGPRLLRMGAAGFLTKRAAAQELITAIRRVAQGRRYLDSVLAEHLITQAATTADRPPHAVLSDREFQVLCLLASGHTNAEIAKAFSVTSQTISMHRTHILHKMRLRNTADLIQYAIWHRLVPWSPEASTP